MGCVCCSLSSFISIVLDALERATLCTVCAMLTCCLLFTLLMMLILGIGIGYHYCYVNTAVEAMAKAAKSASAAGSSARRGPVMRSLDRAFKRGVFPGQLTRDRARRAVTNIPALIDNSTTLFNSTNVIHIPSDDKDDFVTSTKHVEHYFSRFNKNVTGFAI